MCLDFRIVPYWHNLSLDCQQCRTADRWTCWTNKPIVQSIQCYKQFIWTRQPRSSSCTSWWWITLLLKIHSCACFPKYCIQNVDNKRSFTTQNKMEYLLKIVHTVTCTCTKFSFMLGLHNVEWKTAAQNCWVWALKIPLAISKNKVNPVKQKCCTVAMLKLWHQN
jgi:hypothetical protein